MKVGLLTYHWVPNFGAQLQTLSTYKFLKKNGCFPVVLNWVPCDTELKYTAVDLCQRHAHENFCKSHFNLTEKFSDISEVKTIIERNEITHVVIGSDSLFNIQKPHKKPLQKEVVFPTTDHVFPNPFWGLGFEDIPHVGLSISSQNANFDNFKYEREQTSFLLEKFKYITVRDKWTQTLVSYLSNGNICPEITPDPVFSFNGNVDLSISKKDILTKYNLPEKYVLLSFNNGRMKASEKWIKEISERFHNIGCSCIYLSKTIGGQKLSLDGSIDFPLDPLDWYYVIKYSFAYIGVLMHPIIVCLHNAVPFYSFDHYGLGIPFLANKKSSKIYDILKQADLLQNHYFLKNHISFPSSDHVFNQIVNFSKEKCQKFAEKQQQLCLNNMYNLLERLNK